MVKNIEIFIPQLLKCVQRNQGILDIWEAEKIFGKALVEMAIKRKSVGIRTIILNAKTASPLRIKCITIDWDGSRPSWLDRYKKEER